jgi:SulP family sulfate permease
LNLSNKNGFQSLLFQMQRVPRYTVAVIKLLPRLTTAIPAPLMAILTTTGLTQVLGLQTRTVGGCTR